MATPDPPIRILTIGDPHFKYDNVLETDLMTVQIRDMILREKPDFVVVLGDVLHSHEKINLYTQDRAISFLRTLKNVSPYLFVLIGNHDRPNNSVFLTEEHPFNSLKEWGSTVRVIDKPQIFEYRGASFAFAPYVFKGRFEEAMATINLVPPYAGLTCIFAHQEFRGCKDGGLISKDGDAYSTANPLCISGHIHEYGDPQSNIVYVGTPIQHKFTDPPDKTISMFTFTQISIGKFVLDSHQRYELKIPKRIIVELTPQELLTYEPPEGAKVLIQVTGDSSVITQVKSTDHVRKLLDRGVRIKDVTPRNKVDPAYSTSLKVRVPFRHRLVMAFVCESEPMQATFVHVFPNLKNELQRISSFKNQHTHVST